jgi:hypothetical protein
MWGIDGNKQGIDNMVMLNVSQPNTSISLLTQYVGPNSSNNANYDEGLSTGGKAGVAVGCVVGV